MSNTLDVGMGATGTSHFANSLVKVTRPFYSDSLRWFTRIPLPVENYFITLRIFSAPIWISVLSTLFVFSCLFCGVYQLYGQWPYRRESGLRLANVRTVDFFLYGVFSIQESDALPWFKKRTSAGDN